jgi:prenylcysteine oxidase / farnesylcysteine lyase
MTNLAIIGAGIGGCAAAYFARKNLPNVNITIYDAQDRIGGRILTYNGNGAVLELGATFFNRFNRTVLGIVKDERLKMKPVKESKDFAVWNGSEFLFRSSKQSSITNLRLLAKYKLNLTQTFLLLRKAKGQVTSLYQEEQKKPRDIGEICEIIGLDKWYKKSFFESVIERGISEDFIDEIVTPIIRVIYSQNEDIGGFAGISSLIGVYSGTTYSLEEGNSTMPDHLAKVSNAKVKLGQKVDKIEKTSNGTYKVYTGEIRTVFDAIIIAAPLDLAKIEFDGISMQGWEPQSYQTVYKKILRGVFDPAYFGMKSSAEVPAMVLTTKDVDPITHYSIQKVSGNESLVTISSLNPINSNAFEGVFKNDASTVLEHCWKAAYPKFKPLARLPSTHIDKRLIYASTIEPAVSSMETSVLSALNAIKLL